MPHVANRHITLNHVAYNPGDPVDTTGWSENLIDEYTRMGILTWEDTSGSTGVPTQEFGLLSALPANGSRIDNSTYFATDQFGGTPYRMVNGAWVQSGAGVTQASGQIIAGPVQLPSTGQVDVKAIGAVNTDVPGMSLNVPASARPVLLRASFELQANTGTAASGSLIRFVVSMTDAANAAVASSTIAFTQVGAVALVLANQVQLEAYLAAPVTAATYKIRTQLVAAAPANWTSALILPGNGSAGTADNFYAQAV